MAVTTDEDTGDIVFGGFEQGVGISPHKGLGNMQNVNLNTVQGEALISFGRLQDTMTSSATGTGTLSFLDSSHVNFSITGSNGLFKGNWVDITSSSNTGELPNGIYYVPPSSGGGFQLAPYYNVGPSVQIISAEVLAVGGGGAGGAGTSTGALGGGGGGAGGVNFETGLNFITGSIYTVTVGAGGTAVAASYGGAGIASTFAGAGITTVTGQGGGGGGSGSGNGATSGGSGGGASGVSQTGAVAGTQGHAGGGTGSGSSNAGGGGGGDGIVGSNGVSQTGGAGGNGTANSITGSSVIYGGGGGGGAGNAQPSFGAGGTGGGANGGAVSGGGGTGTANTGGGGGGGAGNNSGAGGGGNGGTGIVVISIPTSYGVIAVGGTHTTSGGNDIWTFTSTGTWVPTIPVTPAPTSPLTGFTTGLTATIQLVAVIGKPISSATEYYVNNTIPYNRYYVLDSNNLVWVYDTINENLYTPSDNVGWLLPDYQTNWTTQADSIAIISGYLVAATSTGLFGKSVALLGNTNTQATTWMIFYATGTWDGAQNTIHIPHFAYVGHQGYLNVTDKNYVAQVFPDSTLADPGIATGDNVQSFCSWIGITTTTAFFSLISGTGPNTSDSLRLPAVFFTNAAGRLPNSMTANTVYYIATNGDIIQVYAAGSGGSPLDVETGAIGTQYFNVFFPFVEATASGGSTATMTFVNQRFTLPNYEIAQCMTEIGNLIVIGCIDNIIYPWDQSSNLPTSIIALPENNVPCIVTVNQMAYILAGNKGNIYITDGSVASLVTTIPDYCAGIPGSPETYIEPYFTWQTAAYIRGRVYFSILDQTNTKIGNCGGVWSFVPTQNFYIGQDTGIALRLENQNSYGTYSGAASVLIPKINQQAISPQYFSGWFSDITTPTYGIDATGTLPTQNASIETDLIATGTILGQQKKTFTSEEYKVSSPLLTGETIQLSYRLDLTNAWTSCGPVQDDDSNMSGYFPVNFQNSQWVQFQAVMTPNGTSTFSGNRLTEIRLHPSKYDSR